MTTGALGPSAVLKFARRRSMLFLFAYFTAGSAPSAFEPHLCLLTERACLAHGFEHGEYDWEDVVFPECVLSLALLDFDDLCLDLLLEVSRHIGPLAVLGQLPLQPRQGFSSHGKHVEHDLILSMRLRDAARRDHVPTRAGT